MFHSYLNIKSKFEKLWGHKIAHVSSHNFYHSLIYPVSFIILYSFVFTGTDLLDSNSNFRTPLSLQPDGVKNQNQNQNPIFLKDLKIRVLYDYQFLHRSPLAMIPREHYYIVSNDYYPTLFSIMQDLLFTKYYLALFSLV